MSRPPTTLSPRLELRAKASVVVEFELGQLVSTADAVDEVLDFLDEDCDQIRTAAGHERWSIKDSRRTRTLTEVSLGRLRKIRERVKADTTPLQQTLDRSLKSGWAPANLDRLSLADARSLSVVANWWGGARANVPTSEEMRRLVDRLSMFDDIRTMANDHFVGRRALLTELREHFRRGGQEPFVIHGLGGIGKSALLARHMVWSIDHAGAKVALLDFDDATLNPHYPADLVARIVDRVGRQVQDDQDLHFRKLSKATIDIAEFSFHDTESHYRISSPDGGGWESPIGDLVNASRAPILVVFDTVEQVQRRGPAAIASLLNLVDSLLGYGDRIRVVISGRVELQGLPAHSVRLVGLERDEAVRLLAEVYARPMAPELAEAVVDQIGTSPLTVRLAAQLLTASEGEPSELFALDVQAEQIDAELYRRVLAHIRDKSIRKLAHPGLILRRITADIIHKVLAKPCGVHVTDAKDAEDLFARFADEAMLVDRGDGSTLIHRSDVRAIMLPQLRRDRPDDARRIQRAAVKYYAAHRDHVSKVEELYHRLMLGQSAATLDKHWDPHAAEALSAAIDELPRASRVFLAAHLPQTYLRADDRRLLSDAAWTAKIEPQALRLIFAHDVEGALALLRERRTDSGGSLLPGLEIEVLESLGRLDEAIGIARTYRRSAASCRNVTDVVTFSLHLCRLLERTGHAEDSGAVLEETLTSIRDQSIDRLRLLVAWLGVSRRRGRPDLAAHDARRSEAIALHERLGPSKVRKVDGLLRDLAAEVGTHSVDIVKDALQTVGLDAHVGGTVPVALEELDRATARKKGNSPGMVADIARLERTAHATDYVGIAKFGRGETGSALSEVMTTFPEAADELTAAVTDEYQLEADNAYLGQRQGAGRPR